LVNGWGRGIRHLIASPKKPTRAEIVEVPEFGAYEKPAMALLRLLL